MANPVDQCPAGASPAGTKPAPKRLRPNVPIGAFMMLAIVSSSCSKSESPDAGSLRILSTESTNVVRPEPWFEEIAAQANLTFHHSSGQTGRFWFPEIVCGGGGLLDYDGDGYLDVFCVNGGSVGPAGTSQPGSRLYRNLGNWKFEDVTDQAGVGGAREYGMGTACADYDNDGRVDILVTNLRGNTLYRNNGDGTFTDVTRRAGLDDELWGTSAAFFDYDADDDLDLVIANYVNWSPDREIECYSRGGIRDYCSPMNYRTPAMDALYRNKGDGTFQNVTLAAGLGKAYGNGLGVTCADLNRDGQVDIYVANDAMANQLWINQGDGSFKDEAMIRGCAFNSFGMAEAGMGVVAADLLQRGELDLFVTHLEGEANRLYANSNGYFTDLVTSNSPGVVSWPYTGFGLAFADFDNDGNLDLYVANGKVKLGQQQFDSRDPYAEPNNLLQGLGNGSFRELLPHGGTRTALIATSRGLAVGDLDNDGAMDLVVINRDGPVHLLRNLAGPRGNWIMFKVLNRRGGYAFNSTLRIATPSRLYWRHAHPNEGYCSSNDPRVHCGLGTEQSVEQVAVRWSRGAEETFGPFQGGRIYELREGSGR